MVTRRHFIKASGAVAGSLLVGCGSAGNTSELASSGWYMPEESKPHARTWMAFVASYDIWEDRQVPEVQRNLAAVAKTIARYEPVSMLVRPQDRALAEQLLGGLDSHRFPIDLIETELDDLWVRDTGPSFVINDKSEKAAVNFNFNGWGEDQVHADDAKVADFIATRAGVSTLSSTLTLEGGCFELDGDGTAIMTESCILNDNRNPGRNKSDVEQELKTLLGLDKIIWLKGVKGKDITDGHTDFYARFASPGVVVVSRDTDESSFDYAVTRENIATLEAAIDSKGRAFELVILDTPWNINESFGIQDFAAGYVGYYVCNGAVIMQKFGDTNADSTAKAKLMAAFPDHVIEQIAIDGIASGGGSIHCATQQEPRLG